MGSKSRKDHSGRRKRRSNDTESESPLSDESDSRESSPERDSNRRRSSHRSNSSSRRSRRRSSSRKKDSDDSYDSDDSDDRDHTQRKSSRTITEEDIAEYMARKAQRKVYILFVVCIFYDSRNFCYCCANAVYVFHFTIRQ